MIKKNDKTSPQVIPPSIDTVGLVVKNVSTHKEKNVGTIVGTQLLAGVEVRIVEYEGEFFIPETDVAEGLDQDRGNFFNLLERNKDLLINYPWIVMVTIQGQRRKTRLLSFENTRRAIMMVDHNVRDPIRRKFLIERKRQYFQIIDTVCAGEKPNKPGLEIDFDVVGYKYKDRQFRNGIRETLFVTINKKMHPTSPNTVNKLNEMRRNDFYLHYGNRNLKPKWRKDLNERQSKSEIVHEMFSTCAIVEGKLTVEEQIAFERELFDMVSPDLRPEYFPVLIETTKQTQLLVGEES